MQSDGTRYREYPIHPILAPFVKCIWSLESDGAIYDAPRERILPDSCVELVIHYRDPFRSHFANGMRALQPRGFVVGQMRRFLEIQPAGRVGFVAVRFHAHGAYRFLSEPLGEVTNAVVALDNLWKKRANEWITRIGLAGGADARFRIIEAILLESLRKNDRHDPLVDRCLDLIRLSHGQVTVGRLAGELGISHRQLARRFENAVGLTTKEFARVARFLRAVRCVSNGAHQTLTETAVDCGYFDQAHFNHEFREFAGMTPGEFSSFPNVVF